jgi:hypothetical protein
LKNLEFDEIANRIDKLALAQNDNLKMSQQSTANTPSPSKSLLNQSKNSEQQHFELKETVKQVKQSPQVKEKQIEVRRLSFSSTSSSSTSSLDSAKDHQYEHKKPNKSDQNKAEDHESYDENEFEKSDSHNSSSNSL